ncbi:MAG TPA: ROK family protein [Anaerolineaceae bacterium]|nr:ROK family protein [Anaerolineaceae bacterium]HPN53622.1 ROK family protein [Anaerolineaceae bacterium]
MIGAVDIGGTKFAVGMVDEHGKVLARAETPSYPERGLQDGLARITRMLRETAEQAGGALQGIGIGCTGPVDPHSGTLGLIEFLPGWEWFNLVEALQNQFKVPAAIENDADAAALAEAAWGAGQGAARMIYVTVSTGIGGGMVFDGKLYRGAGGSHPEIGHHVIDPGGPRCFCGAHGCWESLASGTAMAKNNGRASAYEICQAAERGEPEALAAIEEEGRYLGMGLANLVTLFVPDVIALGGGVMQSRALFWDKINETIRTSCGLVPHERTRLVPALLGKDVALAGAARVFLQRYG